MSYVTRDFGRLSVAKPPKVEPPDTPKVQVKVELCPHNPKGKERAPNPPKEEEESETLVPGPPQPTRTGWFTEQTLSEASA